MLNTVRMSKLMNSILKRSFWILGILLVCLSFSTGLASAQSPTPSDDQVNAIARQLFCPICENIPLDVCPTQACHDWRELIRQMLAAGKSEAEIKQYFVDHYGARVLSEPPARGLNWLVYVVPPLAFCAGIFLLFMAFRTWRRTGSSSAAALVSDPTMPEKDPGSANSQGDAASSAADDEYAARFEEQLRKQR
jgi:cytochrome c-type biogenesis protein CcmH